MYGGFNSPYGIGASTGLGYGGLGSYGGGGFNGYPGYGSYGGGPYGMGGPMGPGYPGLGTGGIFDTSQSLLMSMENWIMSSGRISQLLQLSFQNVTTLFQSFVQFVQAGLLLHHDFKVGTSHQADDPALPTPWEVCSSLFSAFKSVLRRITRWLKTIFGLPVPPEPVANEPNPLSDAKQNFQQQQQNPNTQTPQSPPLSPLAVVWRWVLAIGAGYVVIKGVMAVIRGKSRRVDPMRHAWRDALEYQRNHRGRGYDTGMGMGGGAYGGIDGDPFGTGGSGHDEDEGYSFLGLWPVVVLGVLVVMAVYRSVKRNALAAQKQQEMMIQQHNMRQQYIQQQMQLQQQQLQQQQQQQQQTQGGVPQSVPQGVPQILNSPMPQITYQTEQSGQATSSQSSSSTYTNHTQSQQYQHHQQAIYLQQQQHQPQHVQPHTLPSYPQMPQSYYQGT